MRCWRPGRERTTQCCSSGGKLDLVIKQKSGRVEDAAVDADQEALIVYQDEVRKN